MHQTDVGRSSSAAAGCRQRGDGKDEAKNISRSDNYKKGRGGARAFTHARERDEAMISPSRLITPRQSHLQGCSGLL